MFRIVRCPPSSRGTGTDCRVICCPGARFNEVVKDVRPRREAVVVIIAGGNDVRMDPTPKQIVDGMEIERIKALAAARRGACRMAKALLEV